MHTCAHGSEPVLPKRWLVKGHHVYKDVWTPSWQTTNGLAWTWHRTSCKRHSCKEGWCHHRSFTSSNSTHFVVLSEAWWPHCLPSHGKMEAQWLCTLSSSLPSQITTICSVAIVPCPRHLMENLRLVHKTLSTLPAFIRNWRLLEPGFSWKNYGIHLSF